MGLLNLKKYFWQHFIEKLQNLHEDTPPQSTPNTTNLRMLFKHITLKKAKSLP